jgi:3',5'-cyclic AMP phosphodiesterase CpdA
MESCLKAEEMTRMIRIALIGDLHYFIDGKEELLEANSRFFERYLKKFFEIEADLHISLGDLTHLGLEQEFQSVYRHIRNSGVNFRHVLGNHDAYALPKSRLQTLVDQPLNDVLELDDAVLLFVDSTRELDPQDYSGTLDERQREWLSAQMQKSPDKPLLLFTHHPVYGTTAQSTVRKMHIDPAIDVREILYLRPSGGFYFNGHNHTHSIAEEGEWRFIQTAASMCDPSYRIVEITEAAIRTKVVAVDDPELLANARILFEGMPGYHSPQGAQGEPADREREFARG